MLNESGGHFSLISAEKFGLEWSQTFTDVTICLLGPTSFPLAPVPTLNVYEIWATYIREDVFWEWMLGFHFNKVKGSQAEAGALSAQDKVALW